MRRQLDPAVLLSVIQAIPTARASQPVLIDMLQATDQAAIEDLAMGEVRKMNRMADETDRRAAQVEFELWLGHPEEKVRLAAIVAADRAEDQSFKYSVLTRALSDKMTELQGVAARLCLDLDLDAVDTRNRLRSVALASVHSADVCAVSLVGRAAQRLRDETVGPKSVEMDIIMAACDSQMTEVQSKATDYLGEVAHNQIPAFEKLVSLLETGKLPCWQRGEVENSLRGAAGAERELD